MAQELGTGYIIISPSTKGLGKAIEGSISDGTASGTQKAAKASSPPSAARSAKSAKSESAPSPASHPASPA